jgi:hypothetical protein
MSTGVLHTYRETLRREDILDEIQDVSPDANYLTTTLATTPVSQTLHQWPEYYTARETTNTGAIEGADNTFADLAVATMRTNITQIVNEPFKVSETNIVVDKVSPKDAYNRELLFAMRRVKNKMEFAVLRGTEASGGSGVARTTAGFIRQTGANGGALFTARASGTSLTEALFNGQFLEESWNQTDDYVVDLVLMKGKVKSDVSKFTAGNTRNIDASDKRLVQAISVYESDFGIVELRLHKDMVDGAMLGMRKDLSRVGYLRKPKHVPNSVTGDNKKGHIVTELLAESRSARPNVYVSGLRAGL